MYACEELHCTRADAFAVPIESFSARGSVNEVIVWLHLACSMDIVLSKFVRITIVISISPDLLINQIETHTIFKA